MIYFFFGASYADKVSHGNILANDVKSVAEKDLVSKVVENVQTVPLSRSQVHSAFLEPPYHLSFSLGYPWQLAFFLANIAGK